MASQASFDITSWVDLQEVDNAVNQAKKEVAQRYDFKGSRASVDLNRTENTITIVADDEFKLNALWEIIQTRMVRRGVPTKNLTPGELERAANDTVKRVISLQQGIPTEAAKAIVQFLKDRKMKKVQARRTSCRRRFGSCASTTSAWRSSSGITGTDDPRARIRALGGLRDGRRAADRQAIRRSPTRVRAAGACECRRAHERAVPQADRGLRGPAQEARSDAAAAPRTRHAATGR